ncbi:MAG TPA: hypothetical protein VIY47_12820, partial [Ignavibacteriaceae bacterium]
MKNDPSLVFHLEDGKPQSPAQLFYGSVEADDQYVPIFGALIQLACENPKEFHRFFAPLINDKAIHPFTVEGFSFIVNLYSTGVMDDWEIFLQWRDEGYVVVNESERRDQDQRFNWKVALGILEREVGGFRVAPGETPTDDLVCSMYNKHYQKEMDIPEAELEQKWKDTKGIDPETGQAWLTPRM